MKKATVLFRLPHQRGLHYCSGPEVDFSHQREQPTGFVLHPFSQQDTAKLIEGTPAVLTENTFRKLAIVLEAGSLPFSATESTQLDYLQLVEKAVQRIQEEAVHKVVCARSKVFEVNASFTLKAYFESLLADENLEGAFIYLLLSPTFGTWIGATPELFFQEDHHKVKTVALAGTLAKEDGGASRGFTDKEKEEQAWVLRFIIEAFKKRGLKPKIDEIQRIAAGNLWHLKNAIEALKSENAAIDRLIEDLHPTPAVGGLPKKAALAFIEKEEKLERSLYSGYLGPYEKGLYKHFYVNLRCMRYHKASNQLKLFAGAGIVADSDAMKEWKETEHKMRTLEKHLSAFLA